MLSASIVDTDTGYSDLELEDYGYLSVSQFSEGQPNGQTARPNDGIDDTQAIQAAMNRAITEGKSVYLPQGDWQVSGHAERHDDRNGSHPGKMAAG